MAMEYNAKISKKNDIAGKNYHRCTKKKASIHKKHAISKKMRIFAVAFNSQESSKQEKHCDIVLTCKFAKFQWEDGAIMLSLDVYAIGTHASAYPQA